MNRLRLKYQQEILPVLQEKFGLKTTFAVPAIKKISINVGVSQPVDPRERKKVIENVLEQLSVITGQKAQMTFAKKAVANYSLRQGDPLGAMVTLRGEKMWQFLDKLISIVLPRVKDFRGVSRTAFDGQGNYSLGLDEQIVFSELNYDKIESVRGLQINIITSASDDQQSFTLLELLGMPFEKAA
jgi:large subunit ribosomal protein L5